MFNQYQCQIQINKQIVEQMQVNQKCNEILGSLLSALEYYAFRISGHLKNNMIFNTYNDNSNLNNKSLNDLRYYIIAQIELFKFAYQNYINQFYKYDFPNNLPKKQIIYFLAEWKSMIHELSDHIFYDATIKLINGNFNISFKELSEIVEMKNVRHKK